jgi:hypothetical protein
MGQKGQNEAGHASDSSGGRPGSYPLPIGFTASQQPLPQGPVPSTVGPGSTSTVS